MRIEYQYDTATNNCINQLEIQLNRLHYVLHTPRQTKPYCPSVQRALLELSDKLVKVREVAIPVSIKVIYEYGDDEVKAHIIDYIKTEENTNER